MVWKSEKNKNIVVDYVRFPKLVLTPLIDDAMSTLDPFYEGCKTYMTSGLRDAYDQLRIIRNYLVSEKLDKLYPLVMDKTLKPDKMEYDGILKDNLYVWQWAWSHLLNAGIIINPPLGAKCLMDYFGKDSKGNTINKKGQFIAQTNHATGRAINLGGGTNGIADEVACLLKALANGWKYLMPLPGGYVEERKQNALHLNLRKI